MARNFIGGLLGGMVGGIVLYLVGFIFWGTPLSALAFSTVDEARGAAVREALAANLTATGTGTYIIPDPGSILFRQGPVATVHFNSSGFANPDTASLIGGLVLAILTGILIASALRIVADRVTDFASRARLAVLFALAITLYLDLGQPIFNHHGPGFWIYTFLSNFLGLAACGLVIARFFLPNVAAPSAQQR